MINFNLVYLSSLQLIPKTLKQLSSIPVRLRFRTRKCLNSPMYGMNCLTWSSLDETENVSVCSNLKYNTGTLAPYTFQLVGNIKNEATY